MLPDTITIWVIIGAAFVDSVNPCVLGVLIFLIAFMTQVFKSRTKMLIGGLLYSGVVYATYLALGFGILHIAINTGFASTFYFLAALVAILFGLLEMKDFFWYGRWFSLEMLPGGARRLKYYTQVIAGLERKRTWVLLFATALLGVFVVLVELPCTGAPYFAILGLLAEGEYAQAVPLLLLYNLVFVLPLLFVILIAYLGVASETLERWRKTHRGFMRLCIGIFLVALGAYMLYSLPPVF